MRMPHDRVADPYRGICPFHGDCLEGLASGSGDGSSDGACARSNLPPDHPAWRLEARYLAAGVVNLVCTLSPRRVIMGGGVMEQAHLFPMIREEVAALMNGYVAIPEIGPPGLGNNTGCWRDCAGSGPGEEFAVDVRHVARGSFARELGAMRRSAAVARRRRSSAFVSRSSCVARPAALPGVNSRPVSPSCTNSGLPPTRTRRDNSRTPSLPSANWKAPRESDGSTKISIARSHGATSWTAGWKWQPSPAMRLQLGEHRPAADDHADALRDDAGRTLAKASISVCRPFSGRSAHTTPITTGRRCNGNARAGTLAQESRGIHAVVDQADLRAGTPSSHQFARHGLGVDDDTVCQPVDHAAERACVAGGERAGRALAGEHHASAIEARDRDGEQIRRHVQGMHQLDAMLARYAPRRRAPVRADGEANERTPSSRMGTPASLSSRARNPPAVKQPTCGSNRVGPATARSPPTGAPCRLRSNSRANKQNLVGHRYNDAKLP